MNPEPTRAEVMTGLVHAQLDLQIELDRRINFAMQQNDVVVVKGMRLQNRGEEPLRDLEIRISAEPDFGESWSTRVMEVAGGATYNFSSVDLELSSGFLAGLTERVRGKLWIEVSGPEHAGSKLLLRRGEQVELLARDEWSGLSSLPEILAAFVLPNHPAIQQILRSAADLLQDWTGDPSLSGYQSKDPRRVYTTAAAIYGALQELGLTYVNPPASFEDQGQRVRLPDRIIDGGMATCLDIALLAAGCLEQAGLHPLLVTVEGHAFTAVWLQEECFPEPAMDDALRLRKRVDLNEIVMFDPTCATARPSPGFERAVSEANRWLADPDRFRCVIDVQRARKGRIRPLPERAEVANARERTATDAPAGRLFAPDLSRLDVRPEAKGGGEAAADTASTRLDRWGRKLLDLSLRNRLLNFRDLKKTLPILCPDLSLLEDMLAAGETFQIHARPADFGGRDPRDRSAHERRAGEDGTTALLHEELKARRLHADTTPDELDRRLTDVYRAARLGLEEGGSSALYLAIGFLAWYETESSEQRRMAPLLLLPLELHRKSARQGFTLRQGDEDPRINVTLLELLKQDHDLVIPGLDPLPEDESGLDVPKILRTVRQAVRDIDRWDVVDDVRIGLFSFAKFLMWRDLTERTEQLIRSPVVNHLVNRSDQPFDSGGATLPRPDALDEEHAPTETFCPLPADSSQLAAVFAASKGMSFVLEGPPGTGKSQTITNLIAHCLTEGKTVLFVSEKMAALDVVYRRLSGVGLGRYCLELHSNKAHKGKVLAQLEASLLHFDEEGADEWQREARHLGELRRELNTYARALHVPRATGDTAFRALSRLTGLRSVPRVALRWEDPEALDADDVAALRDVVARLATAGAACGVVQGHPWRAVRREAWTAGWQEGMDAAVLALEERTSHLGECAGALSERLGLAGDGWSLDDLEGMRELAEVLLDSPPAVPALLLQPDWEEIRTRVASWIGHGRTRDAVRAELMADFTDAIAQLDHETLRRRLAEAEASRWPLSWWRRRPVAKALAGVARSGKAPSADAFEPLLTKASVLRKEQERLDSASDHARELLGRYWNSGEAEWDAVARLSDWSGRLRTLALRLSGADLERAAELRQKWARLTSEGRELLDREGAVGRLLTRFHGAIDAFRAARQRLVEAADLDAELEWGLASSADGLGRVRRSVLRWQEEHGRLRDWCAWRMARGEAVRRNLSPLVAAYESGRFESGDLPAVMERSFSEWWLNAVTDREPVLSGFFSPEHERKIQKFRSTDQRYMKLTRSVIHKRLGERRPASSSAVLPNSEMGVLKREIGKKRRQMPVRQLFQRTPNLLPRLKPCLLMSPMSVAQYLDSNYPLFDLVVFDEASQIPVWDAIGAIGRGRQAVIVGDPKQLPPTNFFQRAEDDEDDVEEDVVEDLESILEDCMSAQLPWLPLDWHYRSRHESLITFSNHHYYKNRLLTFPSPVLEGMGVSWCHVAGGVYDKGKSRTNRKEADAVVAEVLRRLGNAALAKHSIGIVTFSQAQQTLIEDLLDAARIANPELEAHFSEDALEPVFVKNLENVQGDERDVILFSICYGPDGFGKVSMNFGPMNREGGERRLNVAITRARREVRVFSTLRAEQIDLARTRARGVHDLKNFLAYAERGPSAIAEATQIDPDADFESPFEEQVGEALIERGWHIHKQVGSARYRIDLAVIDPEAPGRYLLGVECDGANYHRAKTARDRDKLREAVLRDLGWELHRVWSTDWWTNPAREIEKLEAALARAMAQGARDEPAGPVEVPMEPEPDARPEPQGPPNDFEPPVYAPIRLPAVHRAQGEFYDPAADPHIAAQLSEVVHGEGPISVELAARRVAGSWGFDRVRAQAVERVRELASRSDVRLQRTDVGEFLWPPAEDPASYSGFRVPDAEGDGARQAGDLPAEEVANAALHILAGHFSAPVDELVRETSRLFGFKRLGSVVDERMRRGVQLLVQRGVVKVDDEGIVALVR